MCSKINEKKERTVEELREKIKKAKMILFLGFHKVPTSLIFELREKTKENDCELKVAKKRLSKIAFEKENVKIDLEKFKEELCFLFSFSDEVVPAKLAVEFSEKSPLKILGGWFENKFLTGEEIKEISKLKSKLELISQMGFYFKDLIFRLIFVLEYNLKGLAIILNQIKDGK